MSVRPHGDLQHQDEDVNAARADVSTLHDWTPQRRTSDASTGGVLGDPGGGAIQDLAFRHELAVRAALDDPPRVHDDHLVGVLRGGEPVLMVTEVRPLIRRSSAWPIRISSCGSTALVASSSTSRSGSARWAHQRDELPLAGRERLLLVPPGSPGLAGAWPGWRTGRAADPRGSPRRSRRAGRTARRRLLCRRTEALLQPSPPLAQRGERHLAQVHPVEAHRPELGPSAGSAAARVVLPEPVSPTTATRRPGSIRRDTSCSTGRPPG